MAFGLQDMRAFASEWLEELLRVGYYGMEASLGLPLKQRSRDFFAPPKPLLLYGKAYPTRIAETGQTIWIWLDGPHSPERGYLLMLLRYHRPGFDDLPIEDRANHVADTCAHVNEFLEALRKLVTFLEHGRPNYRGPAAIKVASRDIAAAVLRDVDGLTNREIGERLCVPVPTTLRRRRGRFFVCCGGEGERGDL